MTHEGAQIESAPRQISAAHDQLVSVLVPIDNDEAILPSFVEELHRAMEANYRFYEVVFVDNHSNDRSCDILLQQMQKVPHLRLIRLSHPSDTEVSMIAALEHCTGDYAVMFFPGFDRVEDIIRLVKVAQEGFDVVIADRQGMPQPGFLRQWVYSLVSKILQVNLKSQASEFRLLSRKVVAAITKIKHRRRHFKYLNAIVGYRQCMIKTQVRDQHENLCGNRHRRFLQSTLRAFDMVISNSAMPLRFVTLAGFAASALNLAYLFYVLAVTIFKEKLAEGWLTTSVMIGTMFCILFFMLALLSEYVARILEEVQHRPLYFVEMEAESAVTWRPEQTPLNVV
jgi:polyisoprenyl-phosphate glycosyltransferase